MVKINGNLISPGRPSSSSSSGKRKKLSVGAIVGLVFAGMVFVFALLGVFCFCMHKRQQHSGSKTHGAEAGNFSLQVLRTATNDFCQENILGHGAFATVYKGQLDDGTIVAVKKMKSERMTEKGLLEFKNEIDALTNIRHLHLLALLGSYSDENEKILVYEFMPKGTLSEHLFQRKDGGVVNPLDWTQRLRIGLDIARGVEYLHSLAKGSFLHRDLKPSNILLGDDMRAKVADFGLLRLAPASGTSTSSTNAAGTYGYVDPMYADMGGATTKIDVYSFGVILMELITGRRVVDLSQPDDSVYLVNWFRRVLPNKEKFSEVIDRTIDATEETMASINIVAELAVKCCAKKPCQRPEMSQIVSTMSPLVEPWSPLEPDDEDNHVMNMTPSQAMQQLASSNFEALETTSIPSATFRE
ncbi:hypothetical protein MKW94_002763 [Papaver nudicaule]|uniref:Protein kinase domain-containing protein n=1 Tax=Papaver nudicaule TaxID=74823 RepID=A0AA41VEA6_PAPNU|nr:hypothetical protein [Papaver nudicaule]